MQLCCLRRRGEDYEFSRGGRGPDKNTAVELGHVSRRMEPVFGGEGGEEREVEGGGREGRQGEGGGREGGGGRKGEGWRRGLGWKREGGGRGGKVVEEN